MSIQLGSGNVPPQTFLSYKDPDGNSLVSLNRDGTITTQGINFNNGTSQSSAASGSGGGLTTVTVTATSAQILAMNTTPIQLVAAQGAGNVIIFSSVVINYIYGGTAYSSPGGNLSLIYGSKANTIFTGTPTINPSILTGTANEVIYYTGILGTAALSSQVANQPLNIYTPNGNPTTGNGTLIITTSYYIVTIS